MPMNFRYALSFLRLLRIPGMLSVMKDWQAFLRMHFLFAAYESGLLSALSVPCTRETLIETLGVKRPDLLDALLEIGRAIGEVAEKNGLFLLKGKRSRAVMSERGDIIAAMIQANVTYYSDAYRNAARRLQGGELGDDLEEIGELVARFSKGVEPIIRKFVSTLVSGKETMRVLDVGCGSGVHLRSVYAANGNASGIGLEIDAEVARQASENIARWGLGDRFEILSGDIRNPPEAVSGPFDLVTLYNMLYYFDEQDRDALLERIRAMLSPHGRVAVVMNFNSRGRDIAAANLNVVNCSLKGLQPLPGLEEMASVLRHAGFSTVHVHHFIPASTFCGIVAGDG